MGNLHVINPDGTTTVTAFPKKPALEDLQKAVGGLIERVRVRFAGRVRDAFVNEEGLLHSLPFNAPATALLVPPPFTGVVGPLVVWVSQPKE